MFYKTYNLCLVFTDVNVVMAFGENKEFIYLFIIITCK